MDDKRKQEYKMIGLNIASYRELKGISQFIADSLEVSVASLLDFNR